MKKISAIFVFLLFLSQVSSGWGKLGHATVAKVAEKYLTPKARAALDEYLGMPVTAIASDADTYRSEWQVDLGFIPTNPEDARLAWLSGFDFSTPENIAPWSHSVTVDENFKCFPTDNLNGAYINNDAYYVLSLSARLKTHADSMTPDERYRAIALIVHFMGDMHCPMHIVYYPANQVKGHIKVRLGGRDTDLHKIWDGAIFDPYPAGFQELAEMVDYASEEEKAAILEGNIYDWVSRSAKACWYLHNQYQAGDSIPRRYLTDSRQILFHQLRDAGYRLAKVLNDIFE